eukprot:scaffold19562_cov50-Phaeocystis_antarctica.AAC.1
MTVALAITLTLRPLHSLTAPASLSRPRIYLLLQPYLLWLYLLWPGATGTRQMGGTRGDASSGARRGGGTATELQPSP